jgi:hypothetical protein
MDQTLIGCLSSIAGLIPMGGKTSRKPGNKSRGKQGEAASKPLSPCAATPDTIR